MKLNISFSPDLVAMIRAEVAAGQKAVSVTMAQAGTSLKSAWRGQINGAGLGQRLANTIRSQTYPEGRNSLDAAALVWSNAPAIIGAHDTGPLIRSRSGFWLAIPLPAAGKAQGGRRITPGTWEQKTGLRLRFVYRSRCPSLLVADAVRLNTRGQAAVSLQGLGRLQICPAVAGDDRDGPADRYRHRLGAVSLAALVRHLCLRAGMPEELIDVSGLWGAVEGYVISALEAPRASISTLARHFGFDAVESEGRIKFLMRGRIASATVTPDSMAAPASAQGDVMELTRAQETELPQALKWQVARADEDYDAAQVEARRIASESFPMAIPPEEAERRCRRALMEAWVGRESAVFRLPPSRLALDPCDVILLDHDGRLTEMRLVSIADSDLRSVDAVRQDRAVYDLPPGEPRPASLSTPTVFGAPDIVLMDLPQLREDQPAHRPFVAAHAKPWPGEIAVYRSAATDGFALLTTFSSRARMGVLAAAFFAGQCRASISAMPWWSTFIPARWKASRTSPCSAGPMRWPSKPALGSGKSSRPVWPS